MADDKELEKETEFGNRGLEETTTSTTVVNSSTTVVGSTSTKKDKLDCTINVFTVDEELFSSKKFRRDDSADKIWEELPSWVRPMKNVFSLWMVSKSFEMQLKPEHQPVKLYKKWTQLLRQYTNTPPSSSEKPKVYLKRNAFLTCKMEEDEIESLTRKMEEEQSPTRKREIQESVTNVVSLLYQEAVSNVKKNYPPLRKDEAVELASYQHRICKQGQRVESVKEFLPPCIDVSVTESLKSHIKKVDQKGFDLTEEVQRRVDSLDDDSEDVLKRKYLAKCRTKEYYGSVMFEALAERKKGSNILNYLVYRDRPVVVAINSTAIHIFDKANREEKLCIPMSLVLSCEFQRATEEGEHFYSSLLLEFNVDENDRKMSKRLQIFSRQAPLMESKINRWLDEIRAASATSASVGSIEHVSLTLCTRLGTKDFVCDKYMLNESGSKKKVSSFSSPKKASTSINTATTI